MLNKIEGLYMREEQVEAFVLEAERMIKKYGWENESVHPYSFPVKITKIVNDLKDYRRCTRGSREYLIQLANGLADILNKWEAYELQPKVLVRLKSGKEVEVREELANDMIAEGYAEAI